MRRGEEEGWGIHEKRKEVGREVHEEWVRRWEGEETGMLKYARRGRTEGREVAEMGE